MMKHLLTSALVQYFEGVPHLVRKIDRQKATLLINQLLKLKRMKKVFKPMRLFVSMLLIGSSFSFVACSDDDKAPVLPDGVTTQTMFGSYAGKMMVNSIAPLEGEGEEAPVGTDVLAKVENDTVCFEQFPIKDIVLAIVKDEALADKIVEAVGDVNYKVGYKPALTAAKDSIKLVLDPKPLKLSVVLPSSEENEEAKPLLIEVKVVAEGEEPGYAVEGANLKFHFAAAEVLLGEGEEQTQLPNFPLTTFSFNMNQNRK